MNSNILRKHLKHFQSIRDYYLTHLKNYQSTFEYQLYKSK